MRWHKNNFRNRKSLFKCPKCGLEKYSFKKTEFCQVCQIPIFKFHWFRDKIDHLIEDNLKK